jgi:hypothetical protein
MEEPKVYELTENYHLKATDAKMMYQKITKVATTSTDRRPKVYELTEYYLKARDAKMMDEKVTKVATTSTDRRPTN